MAALLRQGARRVGGSVLQRTQAAVTSPAVAEERRRLVPRRMLYTEKRAPAYGRRDEEIQEKLRRLKPYQICWELLKLFPGRKIVNVVAGTTAVVMLASASRAVKEAEKEREKVKRAKKKREQVKGAKKKREQVKGAEKKREQVKGAGKEREQVKEAV